MACLDPMRYMFVNPFTEEKDWSQYDFKELEIAYNVYLGEIRELVPIRSISTTESRYDSAHFQLTQSQVANLQRHSTFYKGHFTYHPIDENADEIWISIENTKQLDLNKDVCMDLIWSNCQATPTLPDFTKIHLYEFVDVCMYYGLETMLDIMEDFCLRDGLHYLPEYFETMYVNYTAWFPRVKSLINEFAMQYTLCTIYPFYSYFPRSECEPEIVCGRRLADRVFAHIFILSGLVRSLILSPKYRLIRQLFVCPLCEFAMEVSSTECCTTRCCGEFIHRTCRDKIKSCEICNHAVSSLRLLRNMSFTDLLNDRKLRYWNTCKYHPQCNVYIRGDWMCTFHKSDAELRVLAKAPLQQFMQLMRPFYEQEYITKNIIREYNILTTNETI